MLFHSFQFPPQQSTDRCWSRGRIGLSTNRGSVFLSLVRRAAVLSVCSPRADGGHAGSGGGRGEGRGHVSRPHVRPRGGGGPGHGLHGGPHGPAGAAGPGQAEARPAAAQGEAAARGAHTRGLPHHNSVGKSSCQRTFAKFRIAYLNHIYCETSR